MIAHDLEPRWRALDDAVRTWRDGDLHRAGEAEVSADPAGTLLYLAHPYSSAAGDRGAFPEMYGWDTFFINLGLLAHRRQDVVRWHVLDQLYQVEQYGFVPNGNRTFYLTRSQPPMLGESVRRYVEATGDLEVAGRYLGAQVELHARTGELWEKLNVVTGDLDLPRERYATRPFHGWASAGVAVLGRRLFGSAARVRPRVSSPSSS